MGLQGFQIRPVSGPEIVDFSRPPGAPGFFSGVSPPPPPLTRPAALWLANKFKNLLRTRKFVILGVWADPAARETLPKGAGLCPARVPGAAQTLKMADLQVLKQFKIPGQNAVTLMPGGVLPPKARHKNLL